jgi:nucleotide-binding universal stress UspA family protein
MRLLVGFDDSDEGRDALELARVLSAESGGSALGSVSRKLINEASCPVLVVPRP